MPTPIVHFAHPIPHTHLELRGGRAENDAQSRALVSVVDSALLRHQQRQSRVVAQRVAVASLRRKQCPHHAFGNDRRKTDGWAPAEAGVGGDRGVSNLGDGVGTDAGDVGHDLHMPALSLPPSPSLRPLPPFLSRCHSRCLSYSTNTVQL